MINYFSELRYKEVIDVHTGLRLGYVCDAEFDDAQGQMISLFGREDDYVLPWKCIVRIGSDIILIDAKEELRRRKRSRRFLV